MRFHCTRRAFLRRAPVAVVAMAGVAWSEPPTPSHFEISQQTGHWLKIPPGRGWIVPWPADSAAFPPPDGWVSVDRTEITLRTPGLWCIEWRLTFERGSGTWRGSSADYWDGIDGHGGWHDLADASAGPPCPGSQETTSVGWAYIQSDGRTKVRITAGHDADRPVNCSDRSYECSLALTRT